MVLLRRDFRVMRIYEYMKGWHQEQSLENLKQRFGKTALTRTQVFFWFCECRQARRSFQDAHRCSTPATVVTVTNIETAEKLIRAEPRVTTREIQESLSIGTAATIFEDHLRIRKRSARWLPRSLADEQWRGRLERCEFNEGRSKLTWEVLTGDEIWIYRYDPVTKI